MKAEFVNKRDLPEWVKKKEGINSPTKSPGKKQSNVVDKNASDKKKTEQESEPKPLSMAERLAKLNQLNFNPLGVQQAPPKPKAKKHKRDEEGNYLDEYGNIMDESEVEAMLLNEDNSKPKEKKKPKRDEEGNYLDEYGNIMDESEVECMLLNEDNSKANEISVHDHCSLGVGLPQPPQNSSKTIEQQGQPQPEEKNEPKKKEDDDDSSSECSDIEDLPPMPKKEEAPQMTEEERIVKEAEENRLRQEEEIKAEQENMMRQQAEMMREAMKKKHQE